MKNYTLTFLMIFLSGWICGQSWQYHWANAISTDGDERDQILVEVDADDHVYVAAQYRGALSLAGENFPAPVTNGRDIVVARYNGNGAILWAVNIAGDGGANLIGAGDLVNGIAVDSDNNLYVVGNLGPNAAIAGTNIGNGDNRNFVAKFSPSGSLLWTVLADHDYLNDYFTSVHITSSGDVLVSAQSGPGGQGYSIEGVLPNETGVATDDNPSMLIKISGDGNVQWVRSIPGPAPSYIKTAANGDIYVCARALTGATTSGVYLIKLDGETIEEVWTRFVNLNTNTDNDFDLGLHVKADGTVIHFFKSASGANIGFGDGFESTGGVQGNIVGLMFHVDSDGQTLALHQVFESFADLYQIGTEPVVRTVGFGVINDDEYYIVGRLMDEVELAAGGELTPDPYFVPLPSQPGYDALVLRVNSDLEVTGAACQTGSGVQHAMNVASFSNGDAAVGGFYRNFSHAFYGTSTTVFAPTSLTAPNEGGSYFVNRVTTGFQTTSVNEIPSLLMNVYPVPAIDRLTVEAELNGGAARLMICDMAGNLVMEHTLTGLGWVRDELDISMLSNGIYLMKTMHNGSMNANKLVIAR